VAERRLVLMPDEERPCAPLGLVLGWFPRLPYWDEYFGPRRYVVGSGSGVMGLFIGLFAAIRAPTERCAGAAWRGYPSARDHVHWTGTSQPPYLGVQDIRTSILQKIIFSCLILLITILGYLTLGNFIL